MGFHFRALVGLAFVALCGCSDPAPAGSGGATGGAGGSGGSAPDAGSSLPRPQKDGDDLDLGHFERLTIGLLGDTRPASPGGAYPLQTITHIYQELDRRAPDFAVTLGDYIYVSPSNLLAAQAQMQMYLSAQQSFHGAVYYVLGNHEGYGDNIVAFRQTMNPAAYYSVHGTVGVKTFKFVIIADDVWTPQEETWVKAALAKTTDYTFVCRHHPSYNTDTNEQYIYNLIQPYPRTLLIDGHTHLYNRESTREVVIGNGGAPLDGNFLGYATLEIDPAGTVTVKAFRESDDAQMDSWSVGP